MLAECLYPHFMEIKNKPGSSQTNHFLQALKFIHLGHLAEVSGTTVPDDQLTVAEVSGTTVPDGQPTAAEVSGTTVPEDQTAATEVSGTTVPEDQPTAAEVSGGISTLYVISRNHYRNEISIFPVASVR
ncbi:hypothetical protein D2F49_23100 [Salmonella enterica]|nr:hypothetical protein [Salmonella enterica]